jgi:hypothetical protein
MHGDGIKVLWLAILICHAGNGSFPIGSNTILPPLYFTCKELVCSDKNPRKGLEELGRGWFQVRGWNSRAVRIVPIAGEIEEAAFSSERHLASR